MYGWFDAFKASSTRMKRTWTLFETYKTHARDMSGFEKI